MWVIIAGLVVVVPVLLLVLYVAYTSVRLYFKVLPGIPMIYGYPLIGRALDILPMYGNLQGHDIIMAFVQKYGSIFQYFVFNRHVVLINDGRVLKQAMEQIKDKGAVHVSPLVSLSL